MTRRLGQYNQPIAVMASVQQQGPTGAMQDIQSVVVGHRWADVVPQRSREYERLQQTFAEMTAAYNIPGYLAVRMDHKVLHDGQELEIIGIETKQNRDPERAEEITIVCRGKR